MTYQPIFTAFMSGICFILCAARLAAPGVFINNLVDGLPLLLACLGFLYAAVVVQKSTAVACAEDSYALGRFDQREGSPEKEADRILDIVS